MAMPSSLTVVTPVSPERLDHVHGIERTHPLPLLLPATPVGPDRLAAPADLQLTLFTKTG